MITLLVSAATNLRVYVFIKKMTDLEKDRIFHRYDWVTVKTHVCAKKKGKD